MAKKPGTKKGEIFTLFYKLMFKYFNNNKDRLEKIADKLEINNIFTMVLIYKLKIIVII